ncbi:MAG: type II toxin-antitoxin system ParD family antitoxin [Gimesia chilikensis]|uniref:type II toxin-antitoxin system ParD family antitoxin n=1 Tax=Gimesia chilikensis TaxID=2605989 RepID=UPI00378CA752
MSTGYPPEILKFIEEEMASGHYEDESALVTEALEVFRELKQRHAELKQQIQQSLEAEREGRMMPLDIDAIVSELESEVDETGQPVS